MSLHAMVYTADGVGRFDDLEAAISVAGDTWIHAVEAEPTELRTLRDTLAFTS